MVDGIGSNKNKKNISNTNYSFLIYLNLLSKNGQKLVLVHLFPEMPTK
jgi:hypothetical protein